MTLMKEWSFWGFISAAPVNFASEKKGNIFGQIRSLAMYQSVLIKLRLACNLSAKISLLYDSEI